MLIPAFIRFRCWIWQYVSNSDRILSWDGGDLKTCCTLFVYLVRLYSRRARFLWYMFNFIRCYKNNGNTGISIFDDLWIWFWDSEFAFTCHQTDLFMVPPIPSTAPLPWNVTKKFQIKLVENSFSHLYKLENKYRCLNCELAPSLNTLISLIDEYVCIIK